VLVTVHSQLIVRLVLASNSLDDVGQQVVGEVHGEVLGAGKLQHCYHD
jgi:hypothetical protein